MAIVVVVVFRIAFYTFRYKESLSAIRVTDSSSSRQQTRLRSIRHENAEDALGIGIANVYLHPGKHPIDGKVTDMLFHFVI